METLAMCQELHVLPKSGGLLDQDGLFVHLMKHAMMAQNERRELDNHNAAKKARKR